MNEHDDDGPLFENGRPVPHVEFDYPEDSEARRDIELAVLVAKRETAAAIIAFATEARTWRSAGRRMLALAYVLRALPGIDTQVQLSVRLGCSEAAASKLRMQAKRALGEMNSSRPKVKTDALSA